MNQMERSVMPQHKIYSWFVRFFSVPRSNRPTTVTKLAERLGVSRVYLYKVFYEGTRPLTHRMQIKLSHTLVNLPYPEPVDKNSDWYIPEDNTPKPIPDEVYKQVAQTVGCLSWEDTKYLGIDPKTVKICKLGGIPQFRRKTLRRLYKIFTGKNLEP